MPNWYTTRIEVVGKPDLIAEFRAKHFVEDEFCFHSFIPMPSCLNNIESSSDVEDGVNAFMTGPEEAWAFICKQYQPRIEMIKRAVAAKKECGHLSWYTWCNENWGTKWNASDTNFLSTMPADGTFIAFEFNTAWGPPEPVIAKMIFMYPDLSFDVIGHGEEDVDVDDEGNVTSENWSRLI